MKFSAIAVFSAVTGMAAATPQYNSAINYGFNSNPFAHSSASSQVASTTRAASSSATSASTSSASKATSSSASATQSGFSIPSASSTQPAGAKVTCLTTDTANTLINGFASLLTNYSNATANSLLASDFSDTSDSINQLAGYPIGGPTFANKTAFMQGQGSQPAIGFTVLNVDAINCTNVAFRWSAVVGEKLFPIKGVNSFVASNLNGSTQGWQIKTMYSEFNSLGWFLNVGGTITPPS